MKKGAELIADERKRQIEVEGWNAEHDAQYTHNELISAAMCYLQPDYGSQEIQIILISLHHFGLGMKNGGNQLQRIELRNL